MSAGYRAETGSIDPREQVVPMHRVVELVTLNTSPTFLDASDYAHDFRDEHDPDRAGQGQCPRDRAGDGTSTTARAAA
jgi:hypothetical protein